MTEERLSALFLNKETLVFIHEALQRMAEAQGEPIPPFSYAKDSDIDALIMAPQQRFFGREAYPTLEEKAAIIFYSINKRQIFLNGNKRMSTLTLLVFLGINDKTLGVSADDLTDKALWLAKSSSLEFPAIKEELVSWIRQHLTDLK